MALCHGFVRGSIFSSKCNYLLGSTQTRWRVYTALPYSLAGFKGWAREGGVWEGREGSMIKGEAEGVRKKERGGTGKKESRGKVKRGKEGSFAPTVFKSRRLRGSQAHRSVPGAPRWQKSTQLCVMSASVAP